jgi:DNA-binding MarR family transcriptional regulator
MLEVNELDFFKNVNVLYRFVSLFSSYENTPRDYGTGEDITMTEMHVLASIETHPEITGTELAAMHLCTTSAISQVLKKLEDQGYIVKMTSKANSKKKALYVTAEGKKICRFHEDFDLKTLVKTYHYLRRDCEAEEIQAFFKVMQVYNNIMEAGSRKQKQRIKDIKKAKKENKTE